MNINIKAKPATYQKKMNDMFPTLGSTLEESNSKEVQPVVKVEAQKT
jgi:hypothetical protein